MVCDGCRKPLAVDRWLKTQPPHEMKIARRGRVEKEVCTSCYEHAPAEMEDLSGWRGALAEVRAK